jgi:hypothetical protein
MADGQHLSWPLSQEDRPFSTRMVAKPASGITVRREVLASAPLDGTYVHTVSFVVSPEGTATLTPGRHEVRAVLEAPFWLIGSWRGRVSSAAAVVEIRSADPSLEQTRMAASISYYVERGRYSEARPLVEQLVARAPESSGPQVLLGRVLEGLGDRQGAVDAYTRALRRTPRTYEEPADLIDRIARLTMRLRRK